MDKTMTQRDAETVANQLRDAVLQRTGLTADTLTCPREKSDMTPCVARDGGLAVRLSEPTAVAAMCVGCSANVSDLLRAERSR